VNEEDIALRPADWYEKNQIELILGRRAVGLDVAAGQLDLDDGTALHYEKLLIATGSRARRLPDLDGWPNVYYLRTLADARALRAALKPGRSLVVVGAGFIGQEVAATARGLGVEVTLLEALPGPLASILGEEVGRWFVDLHRGQGVEVLLSSRLEQARGNGKVEELVLENGRRLGCDAVVVGIGVAPAAGWLAHSGLEPDGVLTDAMGRTSIPGVFAAGDVTRSFDPRFGVHSRSEHWGAAARQGVSAAKAMLGEATGPPPLPSFWSDQYGLRIQYLGHAEHADDVHLEHDQDGRELRAVYTRDGRPIAALTVNQPRALIALRREIELSHQCNGDSPKEAHQ
jgi:NADPH-dependent 2,4-dienoyl-CoA reductase/sulfur reductase-like enzyme